MNYYNEIDPYAVQWLKNLIADGLIPKGDVDSRSIKEVQPDDLKGYTQCHFFAGIAGWSLALAIAGVGADTPLWTGSCPCQPFSAVGQRAGTEDERHLWPDFFRLISVCRPPVCFGEQVASSDGRVWLAGVRADLENVGYRVGASDLCAASVQSPHIRQRIYWVGDSQCEGLEGHSGYVFNRSKPRRLDQKEDRSAPTAGSYSWDDFIAIPCGDGKRRRIKPGTPPLVNGFPGRVEQIKGYGNAIVPLLAAEFITAFYDIKK